MPAPMIFILIVCVVAFIGFLVYYFSAKQVIIRTLSKIPNTPPSGLKTNELSKIVGKALHVEAPLIAPYSRRECVFYQMKIQRQVNNGKSSYWKTIASEEKFQDFFIETNGDFVIIKPQADPKNYICRLVQDSKQSSGTFNDPTPKFLNLLKRYHIAPETYFGFNKTLRCEEGIIAIGERITVAGIAKWKSLSEPLPEYPYSKIATLESNPRQRLIITDLPEALPKNS